MSGRVLAIGDIHGCDVALDVLLSKMELTADDTVVVVGDVVDRGPSTRRAVNMLLDVQKTCELIFILGNHEEMMFQAIHDHSWLESWLAFGGRETLMSYGGDFADIPENHLDFLRSGKNYWETDSEIYIHANLKPGVPLEQQDAQWLRWNSLTGFETHHPSGKRVICGHSSQKSGIPAILDGWLCIDTWAYGAGFLTGLDLATNEIYQTQQSGRFRGPVMLDQLA